MNPPRFVVRSGLYRVVRNPMYLSVLIVLGGEVLLFRSSGLAAWAAIVAIAFHLFVVAYEEPTLRREVSGALTVPGVLGLGIMVAVRAPLERFTRPGLASPAVTES